MNEKDQTQERARRAEAVCKRLLRYLDQGVEDPETGDRLEPVEYKTSANMGGRRISLLEGGETASWNIYLDVEPDRRALSSFREAPTDKTRITGTFRGHMRTRVWRRDIWTEEGLIMVAAHFLRSSRNRLWQLEESRKKSDQSASNRRTLENWTKGTDLNRGSFFSGQELKAFSTPTGIKISAVLVFDPETDKERFLEAMEAISKLYT